MIGIAGFAGACQELPPLEKFAELEALRNRFETFIASRIDGFSIQAAESPRLSNTTNLRIQGISSALMLTSLDLAGICLSAGSACSSGSINPSHVLLEMGLSPEAAKECLRISWGKLTTSQEIDQAAQIVVDHVNRIRSRRNGN
jgi:cysteine desulfurase